MIGVVSHPVSEKGERGESPSTVSNGNANRLSGATSKAGGEIKRLNSPVISFDFTQEKTALVNAEKYRR